VYSNPVLAAEPGSKSCVACLFRARDLFNRRTCTFLLIYFAHFTDTALVYRVIITSLGNYSSRLAKYAYYNLRNSYTDLFAAAVASANISRNLSIAIDDIRYVAFMLTFLTADYFVISVKRFSEFRSFYAPTLFCGVIAKTAFRALLEST